jgi:hypothetical protein
MDGERILELSLRNESIIYRGPYYGRHQSENDQLLVTVRFKLYHSIRSSGGGAHWEVFDAIFSNVPQFSALKL